MTDYDELRLDELAAISEFAHQLSDEQWDHSSLCEGWRVRDVVSHMCVGYTTPLPEMVVKLARYRFDVPRASKDESIAFADTRSSAELLDVFDRIHRERIRKGISRFIKPQEGLVDHLVHHQDIRRPLGLPRPMPRDRLRAALEAAPKLGGFVGARRRAEGLRFVATDIDWTHGSGPDVCGAGEALLLALTGRPVALGELTGDGMERFSCLVAA
jgi:uncharacterized protein (TIGR03083 family)